MTNRRQYLSELDYPLVLQATKKVLTMPIHLRKDNQWLDTVRETLESNGVEFPPGFITSTDAVAYALDEDLVRAQHEASG